MPARDRVQAFVALVEQAKYVEALEGFYHPDASMQDNQQAPRLGLERLVADERATMARFVRMKTDPVTDLLIDGDKVMIRWKFTFTPAEGPPMVMEEIALQRWAGDRIAEERFFYDPRQTRPAGEAGERS
jgi:ketosteroid isomerase-like protein